MNENGCWEILKIAPTGDEKAIKKAYAIQLKDNRPDKNKAGFLVLRAAYEDALASRFWFDETESYREESEQAYDLVDNTPSLKISESAIEPNSEASIAVLSHKTDEQKDEAFLENTFPEAQQVEAQDSLEISKIQEMLPSMHSRGNYFNEPTLISDIPDWEVEWCQALDTTKDMADKSLYDCLKLHFSMLGELPLDSTHDFETLLIDWFDEIDALHPKSFALANQHFQWQQRLQSWEAERYPWNVVQRLVDIYQYAYFDRGDVLKGYLASNYPELHAYYVSENKFEKAIRIFKFLGDAVVNFLLTLLLPLHFILTCNNPYRVYELAIELKQFEDELDRIENLSQGKVKTTQWRDLSLLRFLNKTIFGAALGNLMSKKYYLIWASITLLIGAYFWLAPTTSDSEHYFYDFLGGLFIITVFLTIRRLFINLLISPHQYMLRFSVSEPLFYVVLIAVLVATFFYNPSNIQQYVFAFDEQTNYLLANLFSLTATLLLSLVLTRRFKLIYWYYIIITITETMIIPVIKSLNNPSNELEIKDPSLWLLCGVPLLMVVMGISFSWLKYLATIGSSIMRVLPMLAALVLLGIIMGGFEAFYSWGFVGAGLCFAFSYAMLTYYTVYGYNSLED